MSIQISASWARVAARLPARPAPYLWVFLLWAVLLWFLSASPPSHPLGPEIPHFDKVLHFGYFAAGGSLLGVYAGLKWPLLSGWRLLGVVAVLCSVIGLLDEYHQSFVPGRSGNDAGDWLADTLGGMSGCCLIIWRVLPGILAGMPRNT